MNLEYIVKQLNLPNILSFLRLILVPLIIMLLSDGIFIHAFFVFFFCGITDFLDGLIARKFKLQTPLGALLDPLADKILMVSTFLTLSLNLPNQIYKIPSFVTIIIISRDILIVLIAYLLYLIYDMRKFPPSIWGKINTVFEVITVLLVIISNIKEKIGFVLIYAYMLIIFSSLFSGFHYLFRTLRWLQNPKVEK